MSHKKVKCKYCKEEPGFVKHCESTGEVYWALECNCKCTPFYRSRMVAVAEWESVTYKEEPTAALAKVKVHY
jgi:hypothetical protein